MTRSNRLSHRLFATVAAGTAALMLASAAQAVDLRDWGRKFPNDQRFVVLSQFKNQAVLDKETQLVWQRTPNDDFVTFDAAWDSCDRATSGGRMGWRLPALSELRSLMDPAVTNQYMPALPAAHPFIGVVAPLGSPDGYYGRYWTSTLPSAQDATYRLVGHMSAVLVPTKLPIGWQFGRAWCVRGPGQ